MGKILSVDTIMCLLLIVASGNPIFIYSSYVRELYICLAILSLIYCKSSSGYYNYLKLTLPYFFIALLQLIFVDDQSVSSIIFAFIRIFIGVYIIIGIGNKFVNEYVKIMTIVAGVSLILFAYTNIYGYIPCVISHKASHSIIIYTEIYSSYYGLLPRNAGMFWEPGAFQAFLNIAIALALMSPHCKTRTITLIILITALLTTVSTTGYLVFGFIILYYSYKFAKINRFYRNILTIFVCAFCIYTFYTLDFLNDKITDSLSDYESSQGRITDFKKYGELIQDNWVLGVSFKKYEILTGNSLVYMILNWGIPVTIYYFLFLFCRLKSRHNIYISVMLFGVLLLAMQGEVLMFYPIFWGFPFVLMDFSKIITYKTN